jgi:hypothetical protein
VTARPRRRLRRLLPLLLAAALLPGCGPAWRRAEGPAAERGPAGRVLVFARVPSEDNRAVAERAADMLAGALRESRDLVVPRELQSAAVLAGLGPWPRLAERLERGGWPTAEERGVLRDRFGIRTLVATEVTAYEQVWGKYAKFTRVGVEAQAFDVASAGIQWRLRGDAEVEDMRGRAFQYAMERAVRELTDAIEPQWNFSLTDAWRYWRR